jgi:hypothetical protein
MIFPVTMDFVTSNRVGARVEAGRDNGKRVLCYNEGN